MGIARSTSYDSPEKPVDDTSIVEARFAICDEIEFYGYRRVGTALRQQGLVIGSRRHVLLTSDPYSGAGGHFGLFQAGIVVGIDLRRRVAGTDQSFG